MIHPTGEYDDLRELHWYVCAHYAYLDSDCARILPFAISAAICVDAGKLEAADLIRSQNGLHDADLVIAINRGQAGLREHIATRLLKHHSASIFVNRCAKCGRIVRTPQAKQCLHCGYDWHQGFRT